MTQNNAVIPTLHRGMTERAVIDYMGSSHANGAPNLLRTEIYPAGDDRSGSVGDIRLRPTFTVLFYDADSTSALGDVVDHELPIVLENGRLAGWGRAYWEKTARLYNIHRRR